jgi:hypothetical protein
VILGSRIDAALRVDAGAGFALLPRLERAPSELVEFITVAVNFWYY